MSSAGEKPDSYATAVATQLFQTQSLIQNLLAEIRESSSLSASLSAELKHLRVNVQMLSNIIRGDDGNPKPLVMEVEVLKHAQLHFDKRITEIHKDIEDQVVSLGKNMSNAIEKIQNELDEQRKELEAKIDAEEKQRREYETKQMEIAAQERLQARELTQAENVDIRSDSRQRLTIFVSVILAIISLAGTIAVAALK